MSVTLEQVHILMTELQMDTGCFQHALDAMRRWATVVYSGLAFCEGAPTIETSTIPMQCKILGIENVQLM